MNGARRELGLGSDGKNRLRVLVVRVGAMGDVLHSLPAVAALRQAMPDCFIGWAIEPRWEALLRSGLERIRGVRMPLVDCVHAVRTQSWKQAPLSAGTFRDILRLRRELRAGRYDVCVDLQGSIRSAVIGRMAEARRFLGPAKPRETLARALYGEHVALTRLHVIDQACELLSAAVKTEFVPGIVTLPPKFEADVWADYALDGWSSPVALLVPGAGWGAKEWGVARYRALALELGRKGFEVLVNSAPARDMVAHAVAAEGAARVVPMTLPELIGLVRHVDVVIGGDTGPVHLAAALGRPVVALFGPTDPARNGPDFPGAKVCVLRDAASRTNHKRYAETEAGLARIRVDEVVAAVVKVVS